MWHNRFSENESEAVDTHIPRHRDSKAIFQRMKSHDIEIPRLKNHDIEIPRPTSHDIEFLWNSDPYALRYLSNIAVYVLS